MRMDRWAKAGVLDRIFPALQDEEIIRIKVEAVSMGSTIVQVHRDGTSAETAPVGQRIPGSPPQGRRQLQLVKVGVSRCVSA